MRIARPASLLMVVLGQACASAHDVSETQSGSLSQSGSRLRLRWLESDDGLRVPIGLYDSELEQECTVQRAEDGHSYCLPGGSGGLQTVFLDPECKQAAVGVEPCSAAPERQGTVRSAACAGVDVYELQPPELAPTFFYQLSDGPCVEGNILLGPRGPVTVQRLSRRLSARDFVRMDDMQTNEPGSLHQRYHAGRDGSRWPVGFVDARHGECEPALASDGQYRCLPRAQATLFTGLLSFTTEDCSTPVVQALQECEPAQTVLIRSPGKEPFAGTCERVGDRIYEAGSRVEQVFGGPGCRVGISSADTRFYRLGAELSPSLFALLEPTDLRGTRLSLRGWAIPGAQPLFLRGPRLPAFSDAKLSLPCSLAVTSDGARRCAPTSMAHAFSDAACTQAHVQEPESCAPPSAPAYAQLASSSCQVSIHAVSPDAQTLELPFQGWGTQCLAQSSGSGEQPASYALLEPVAPAEFVAFHERIE